MKIIELRAENVQKLSAVTIRPDGAIVQITGRNGAGKSSVLDAIWWALAGGDAIPAKPVRHGADKATVRLDLGEIVVTRVVREDRTSTLTVTQQDGARYPSPQRMLDDLLGAVSFDPLAFTRMDAKAQAALLRKLVPLSVDIDHLDRLNATDYEGRRDVNRTAKDRRAAAAQITVGDGPTDAVDFGAIENRLKDAQRAQALRSDAVAEGEQLVERAAGLARIIADREATIEATRKQIERLEASLATAVSEVGDMRLRHTEIEADIARARANVPPKVDTAPILAEMSDARAEDGRRKERIRKAALLAEATAAEEASARFTALMAEREAQKAKALAEAPFPVPGLGFSADGVTLRGIPFDQASSAEQIRVSVGIGMASNPKIRVMRIKDGSLLDAESMVELATIAEANDFQVFVERVAAGQSVGIEIADGHVAAIDGVPVEQKEAA